jgi:DNA repair exonuclease SbcCD ATPase subunit
MRPGGGNHEAPDSRATGNADTEGGRPDPVAHERLDDLYAQALLLDGERQRICEQMDEIARSESSPEELRELARRRKDISDELHALRERIAALRRRSGGGHA